MLPVEVAVVEVASLAHDGVGLLAPAPEGLQRVREDADVVVHDPEPLRAQLVGTPHALGEPARPAGVLGHRVVHGARRAALGVLVPGRGAPLRVRPRAELGDDPGGLGGVLVVDHHHAPRCHRQGEDRVEKTLQQLLAHEGHDDDGGPPHSSPFACRPGLTYYRVRP